MVDFGKVAYAQLKETEQRLRPQAMAAQRVTTTKNGTTTLSEGEPITFGPIDSTAPSITITDVSAGNRFTGAGAALTDSSAYVLMTYLTKAQRTALLRELFAPDQGNLTWLRLTLGGSDFGYAPEFSDADPRLCRLASDAAVGATTISTTGTFMNGDELVIDANAYGKLSSSVAVGALSFAATVKFNVGDTVGVDLLGSYEEVEVASVSGTSAPFTINITAPLTKVHNNGTLIAALGDGIQEIVAVSGTPTGTGPYTVTLAAPLARAHVANRPITRRDPTLSKFTFTQEGAYLIPCLREILAINPAVKLFGAVWLTPIWMKRTLSSAAGEIRPSEIKYQANYIATIVDSYAQAGFKIELVSPQNEPNNPTGSLTYWPPLDYVTLVKEVRASLDAKGYHSVGILAHDDNWFDVEKALAAIDGADSSIDAVGWHCYAGRPVQQLGVKRVRKPMVVTEMRSLYTQNWYDSSLIMVADIVIGSLRYGCSGIMLWNLALDENGNPTQGSTGRRGVVSIPSDRSGIIGRPIDFYALMHLTRFVRNGAEVLIDNNRNDASRYSTDVITVALRNPDGSKVLLAFNAHPTDTKTIQIVDGALGRAFTVTLASGELTTFVWSKAEFSDPVVPTLPAPLMPGPASVAPTQAGAASVAKAAAGNEAAELTFTHTVPAYVVNGVQVVVMQGADGPEGASFGRSVTLDDVPMRLVSAARTVSGSKAEWIQIYALPINASTGVKTIVCRSYLPTPINAVAFTVQGVDQNDPFSVSRESAGTTSTGEVTVTTPSGVATDLLIAAMVGRTTSSISLGGSQTAVQHQEQGSQWMTVTRQAGAAGSVASTFTFTPQASPDVYAACAVSLHGVSN